MTKMTSATSFVSDLKEAGITITNEEVLIEQLEKSSDQDLALERLCQRGNGKNVSFIADKNGDGKLLLNAFQKHGFDGYTIRAFLENLKTEA